MFDLTIIVLLLRFIIKYLHTILYNYYKSVVSSCQNNPFVHAFNLRSLASSQLKKFKFCLTIENEEVVNVLSCWAPYVIYVDNKIAGNYLADGTQMHDTILISSAKRAILLRW